MALLHRRKAFSLISRYRSSGRFYLSSLSSESDSSASGTTWISCPLSSRTQIQSLRRLLPVMAVGMQSSLSQSPRSYTTVGTCLGSKCTTPYSYTHKCASDCGCLRASAGAICSSVRNCTTTAYPPPASPGEYRGGVGEAEADGAPLNVDEAEGAAPMEGAEDLNMPPYDYPEDDESYDDEDPPPDPEEKLLFSPSDED